MSEPEVRHVTKPVLRIEVPAVHADYIVTPPHPSSPEYRRPVRQVHVFIRREKTPEGEVR
jgi:hypothetical protein